MGDDTRKILMRVLLGRGSDLDKIDMVSNLIAEKMAMSEVMADKITEGSFVAGQNVLKHLLSCIKLLVPNQGINIAKPILFNFRVRLKRSSK